MKNLISLCLIIFLFHTVSATHNRAGEILYKRIAPYTQVVGSATVQVYTYSITVIKYTDDGPFIADRCIDTIYFGDGTKGIAPRINGATACGCGFVNGTTIGCGSVIINSPGYKVKYNVYSIAHTYPGAGSYLIKSFDPNRNQGVHNIPNSVNLPFYIESYLVISSFIGANSSPVLTNPPIDQATVGVCFYHNVGAVDSDGDSLSYEITPCRDGNGQAISGYFYPELGFNGSYSINPVSGLLTWCTPQFLDEYNIAILIKEWRKNTAGVYQLIGYVLRDMQVLAKYGVVGLAKNTSTGGVQISPNPFNDKLEINVGSKIHIETQVFASDGKLIFKGVNEPADGRINLDLDGLKPGIYMLHIISESGSLFRKVVKQ